MEDKALISEIEKSFASFNASIGDIQKSYGKLWQQLGAYQDTQIVPREYLKEMAGNLAHEIRNPLGGISNFVHLLSDKEEVRKSSSVQGILQGIDRIDNIVENLIVFSKPVVLQTSHGDFLKIIQQAIDNVKQENQLDECKFVFSLNTPEKEVFLNLDSHLILQALQNILQNSIEFMPQGGEIKIELLKKASAGEICLSIADEGQGLIENNEAKPFYPFYTTKTNGMGLGLPTSRLIIEKHGGNVSLKENKLGLTVIISLPGTR